MTLQTLDMRFIRYLNLFEKITRISTRYCFFYNNCIVFAVPRKLISKAVGEAGRNVRRLSEIIGRKVKIIATPENIADAGKFISDIISPIMFKTLEITEKEIIISGNKQSKATMIGRNKVRLIELEKIVKEFFGKELKIV